MCTGERQLGSKVEVYSLLVLPLPLHLTLSLFLSLLLSPSLSPSLVTPFSPPSPYYPLPHHTLPLTLSLPPLTLRRFEPQLLECALFSQLGVTQPYSVTINKAVILMMVRLLPPAESIEHAVGYHFMLVVHTLVYTLTLDSDIVLFVFIAYKVHSFCSPSFAGLSQPHVCG